MRKAFLLFAIAGFLLMAAGCKKTTENIVDCIAEALLVSIKDKPDADNSRR